MSRPGCTREERGTLGTGLPFGTVQRAEREDCPLPLLLCLYEQLRQSMVRTASLLVLLVSSAGVAQAATVTVEGRDSAAIQAAIAQARPGDEVRLPGGTYQVTEPILLPSGVWLLGAGQEETVLRYAGDERGAVIRLTGCQDAQVAHLAIDCALNPALSQGIYATDSRRLSIHHVTVRDMAANDAFGPHGIHFNGRNSDREGGVTDSVIADCTIENIGVGARFGSGIRLSWGSSRNQVLRCTVRTTGRGGIFGDNGSTDLVIRGNTVRGSGGEGLGIEVWGGCDRCVIEDNDIDHWLSIGGCDACAVRRNTVSDDSGVTKPYGLEIIGSYCVVTDNTVGDGQGIGVSVSSKQPKEYCYFANNTIRRCYHWGAQFQGEEGGIAYHYLYRCRFLETLVGHPSVKYQGAEGNGFRTNGNARHVVLEECEVSGNGRAGVQLGGAGVDALSFVRCVIADNGGPAVTGPGEYSALEWLDCTVERNGRDDLPEGKPFPTAPPQPVLQAPAEVQTTERATFACPTEGLRMALWDLGDGPPLTGQEVTHIYQRPGEYSVTLIVWDETGRGARAAGTVRVRE